MLLDHGGDPTLALLADKTSAVHLAAKHGHAVMVEMLLTATARKAAADAIAVSGGSSSNVHGARCGNGGGGGGAAAVAEGSGAGIDANAPADEDEDEDADAGGIADTAVDITRPAEIRTTTFSMQNLVNARLQTPMHYAASEGHLDIVQMLVVFGESVNSRDHWGNTPGLSLANFRR